MENQEINTKDYELSRRRKGVSLDRNKDWDRREDDLDDSERRRRLGKSRKSGKNEKDKEPSGMGKNGGGSEYKIDLFENSDEEKVSEKRIDRYEGSCDESDGKHSSAKRKNGSRGKKVAKSAKSKSHEGAGPADRVYSEPKERGPQDQSVRVSKEETEPGYYMEEGVTRRKGEADRGWKKGEYYVEEDDRGIKEFGYAEDYRSRKIEDHLERVASSAAVSHVKGKNKESFREISKSDGVKDVSASKGEAENFKPVEKKRSFKEKSRQEKDEREQEDRRDLIFDDCNEAKGGKTFDRDDKGPRKSKRFREKPVMKGEKTDGGWEETQEVVSHGKNKEGGTFAKLESQWCEAEDGKAGPRSKRGATIVEEERRERVGARERFGEEWDESEDGGKGGGSGGRDAKPNRYVTTGDRIEGGWEDVNSVGRASGRGRGDREEERTYRQKGVRWEDSGDGGRLWVRGRGDDEIEKQRGRDREMIWEELEDVGRSGGRSRPGRRGKGSWSPDGRRGQWRGEWEDYDRDWSDDRDDFEKARNTGRMQLDRDREYRERPREKDYDWVWEREKARDWEETSDRQKTGRYSERLKDRDAQMRDAEHDMERGDWDMIVRRDKADRGRLDQESSIHDTGERERKDRIRVENLRSPPRQGIIPEGSVRGGGVGGKLQTGGPFVPRGGEQSVIQNEYVGFTVEAKWDSHLSEERMRISDAIYVAGDVPRDRYNAGDDEGPPGLDHGFGPGPGRGSGDVGMGYSNFHGRGRGPKGSPGNRGRGGMMGPDIRPFVNNQGSGPGLRGSQQGDKVGRGNRGRGVKGGRGGGRDGQRGNGMPPLMAQGPGPGMGPHFGPLGPSGPLPVLGPGVGLVPGPGMGPGSFSMPPFGGPMGWGNGRGVGELGMMGGPSAPAPVPGPGPISVPRFNANMGVASGPPKFFTPPGAGRGGPAPGPLFAGNPQFAGRGIPSDRGLSGGRSVVRLSAPAGRGPSRGEQNDYSQHFVDTGLRPQNFIRDVELADRFEEYPKLKELITRKDKLISDRATPPMYMQCDLRATELSPELFGTKFDVILVDPPWEEYVRRSPGVGDSMESWTAEEIQNLRIEAIADTPAFIFLWVGDAEGLDQGRNCLKKWGFRRCEDICWVKTNKENPTPALRHDANTLFQHSKEHCLMGIKGTVRRSIDGHIIHANIDTDIIISEEPSYGSVAKPEELYHIIEHFALGQRRLELFGEDHNIRAGWVTAGKGLSSSNFNSQTYSKYFADNEGKVWQGGRGNPPVDAVHLVGTTPEIEALRPKSPPPRPPQQQQSQAGNSVPQSTATNGLAKKLVSASQGTAACEDQQVSVSAQVASAPSESTNGTLGQGSGLGRGGSPKQTQGSVAQSSVETCLNVTIIVNAADAVLEGQRNHAESNDMASDSGKSSLDVSKTLEIGTRIVHEAVLNEQAISQSEIRKLEVHSTVELSSSMHSQATSSS
ncbi:hypothetical protein O6H91_09G064800 [Diphasiastrum complanatum]|uniref:Uncharacterized protein n=2 Tax=Diphasiastrum complanatum TaxID=34168 RepID=A0ACC2CQB2_DIPCM|nr:hypothetical protein O6H91_09G064800 [Diphasiastrum complanatum]